MTTENDDQARLEDLERYEEELDADIESDSSGGEDESGVDSDSGSVLGLADFEDSDELLLTEGQAAQHIKTRFLRKIAEGDLVGRVQAVLEYMGRQGLNLPIFLHALSWGDENCTRDGRIRTERAVLMTSEELPSILENWFRPPTNNTKRVNGARRVMEDFISRHVSKIHAREMKKFAPSMRSPAGSDASTDALTDIGFDKLIEVAQRDAPSVWASIEECAYTKKQRARNMKKDPRKIILFVLAILAYTRSHHNNKIQKMFAVYLKFRGLSARGFDVLHSLGIVMSHKWTADAVSSISEAAIRETLTMIQAFVFLLSYDNVQMARRVFSQRISNQGSFGNGTAATIYVKRDAPLFPVGIGMELRTMRALGVRNPLTALQIFELAGESWPRIQHAMARVVLRFLLETPAFDFKTYTSREDVLLTESRTSRHLPFGAEHRTSQYLLGTVDIPEASYEDNLRLIDEWLAQLDIKKEKRQEMALNGFLAICGDQLTVDRLRGLYRLRGGDANSDERLDWLVLVFGWFHLQMTFASSLHDQYIGTNRGYGLRRMFSELGRKGLQTTSIKGPFHHHLDDALQHITEAHVLLDWKRVGGVHDLSELRCKTPTELLKLAESLVERFASTKAMNELQHRPVKRQDTVEIQTIMFMRDVLQYVALDHAVKTGDIGLMEDMLPHLFYRFVGGNNNKYAIEVLELLQSLHREWPPAIASFVREHCWLVNFAGKEDSFLPVDLAQEHNIKDIKVTYRSEGPSISWAYLKKLHPAIPIVRQNAVCIETEFGVLARGKSHTKPKKDEDVERGMNVLEPAHEHETGRSPKESDKVKDFTKGGTLKVQRYEMIERWRKGRTYLRSVEEEWTAIPAASEAGESDEDVMTE